MATPAPPAQYFLSHPLSCCCHPSWAPSPLNICRAALLSHPYYYPLSRHRFRDHADERAGRERSAAERLARAAAWELEKEEAKLNKVRAERLKRRTEDARHARHAATLRRFWHTHHGVTRQDMALVALVALSAVGLALVWRGHLQRGGERRRSGGDGGEQRRKAEDSQQQQQHWREQPGASAATVAAAAAGVSAGQPS